MIEAASRERRHDQSQEIDKEDAAQLLRVQVIRRSGEIEVRVGKRSHQAEQRRESHAEHRQQSRIPQVLPAFREGMRNAGRAHESSGSRQRALHDDSACEVHDADRDERVSPGKVVGDDPEMYRPRNPPSTVPEI